MYNAILPKHVILDKFKIYAKFFFANVGPSLATKIPQSDCIFKWYLPKLNTALNQTQLREGEFEVLKSLQSDKASGLNVHVITSVYGYIKMPLLKIFNESLILGVSSENWKIAKLAPIFKSDRNELSNYRLISVLLCFSKIMEKIVHNRLYRYVHDNNLFF